MTQITSTINLEHLIKEVQSASHAKGERMTGLRRDVLEVLAGLKTPMGAYQILDLLNNDRQTKLSAMSLYRTLDFLIDIGVVIKLESLNAYRLCADHPHSHSHLMIVCDGCGSVKEIDDEAETRRLQSLARRNGHVLNHHVIELHGTCAQCAM